MSQAKTSENPLRALRLSKGLSMADFATLLGVTYGNLSFAELGGIVELPPTLRAGLEAIGEDPQVMSEQYRQWRDRRRAELLAQQVGK